MKKTFRLSDSKPDARGDARDEVGFHLEMRTREFMEQGMGPEEARRAAIASFGNVGMVRAEMEAGERERQHRRARREWWSSVARDGRVALRSFRRRPLFAASTIAALGLGIGAAGSVFAVVNGVLLKPLPYVDPEQLTMVWLQAPPDQGGGQWPVSAGFYDVFGARNRTFRGLGAVRSWPIALGDLEETVQLSGAKVTPSVLSVLGVRPELGRWFSESEGLEGGPRVALLSYALWRDRFGSDQKIVGRKIMLGGQPFEVVGVMPREFAFPRGAELMRGLGFGARTDVWIPLSFSQQERENYGTQNLAVVGRLRDGTGPAAARDDVAGIVDQVLKSFGARIKIGTQVVSLKDQAGQPVRRGLWLLLGAVATVLLIACANVAGLLSARVAERRREFAVRQALGARQPRVARQLVTETLALAAAGGLLGAATTHWGTRLLLTLAPIDLPRTDDIGTGLAVMVAVGAVTVLSGIAFGLIAMRGLSITNPAQALQGGAGRTTGTRSANLGRRILVAGQVALSVLLLIGAGLLLRSFVRIQEVRPGFVADGSITGRVVLPLAGRFDFVRDSPAWAAFFEQFLDRAAQVPGVTAVGAINGLPLTGMAEGTTFAVVGREPARREDWAPVGYQVMAGDFFRAAGIGMVTGRPFERLDRIDGPHVAIVSRALANKFFPSGALGESIRCGCELDPNAGPRQIVGVVDDVKYGTLEAETPPMVYLPQSQMPYPGLYIAVRTDGRTDGVVSAIRRELKQINPAVALSEVRTLSDILASSMARQRFTLTLIGAFAVSALLLAVLGLYGVIAISVQARRRELGVRLALGARPVALVQLVVVEGMRLAGVGAAIGVLGAFAIAGTLRALLYGISARDFGVYAGAATIVVVVALIATYLPARAAARGNPTEALRTD